GAAAEAGVSDAVARGERLTMRSPTDGWILTPRPEDLQGRFVKAGTVLAEVGDSRKMLAELPVSERLLDELSIGATVRALVPQRPLRPISGRIIRISSATLGQPSTVAGTSEPAAPSARPDQFVAVAEFDNSDADLKTGAIVRAKIYSRRASYAARTTRVLVRWLQTIFW
ncbi:MAG: HlyD family secretion protein, partial [Acidobacteriota bacterium]|nr:HlyD family secretion protein [Acidobacteriota bacterium]